MTSMRHTVPTLGSKQLNDSLHSQQALPRLSLRFRGMTSLLKSTPVNISLSALQLAPMLLGIAEYKTL